MTVPGTRTSANHFLQADGSDVGDTAAPLDVQSTVPITDISPESLVDTATPLESQPAVQGTLETQQQHAAVYAPDSDVSGTDATLAVDSQIGSQDAALGKAAKKGAVSSTSGKSGMESTACWPRHIACHTNLGFTRHPHNVQTKLELHVKTLCILTVVCHHTEGSGTASPRQKYSGKLTFTAAPHTPMVSS